MTDMNSNDSAVNAIKVGFYSGIFLVMITSVTFGLALSAIPIAGANCPGGCIEYPYLDTTSQYPKDFLWMYPAMLLVISYLILVISIHVHAPRNKKIFSHIGLVFSIIASVVLLTDYYMQFSIVPVSLNSGENQGLPLLIQYNPHGVFIALEELGYLMMSLSFLFIAPVFDNKTRLETSIKWTLIIGFILGFLSLVVISSLYGLEKLDRFEVFIISINWLVLIICGTLVSFLFRRHLQEIHSI